MHAWLSNPGPLNKNTDFQILIILPILSYRYAVSEKVEIFLRCPSI
jgi:hypothetical protein